jgi:hypothetical protein
VNGGWKHSSTYEREWKGERVHENLDESEKRSLAL